jgi:hypothetical protein
LIEIPVRLVYAPAAGTLRLSRNPNIPIDVINLSLDCFREVSFGIEHLVIALVFDFDSDPDSDFEERFQASVSLS